MACDSTVPLLRSFGGLGLLLQAVGLLLCCEFVMLLTSTSPYLHEKTTISTIVALSSLNLTMIDGCENPAFCGGCRGSLPRRPLFLENELVLAWRDLQRTLREKRKNACVATKKPERYAFQQSSNFNRKYKGFFCSMIRGCCFKRKRELGGNYGLG